MLIYETAKQLSDHTDWPLQPVFFYVPDRFFTSLLVLKQGTRLNLNAIAIILIIQFLGGEYLEVMKGA